MANSRVVRSSGSPSVLDADHDGVLSAAEIQNAVAALGKLDRNGDGKITPEEMRPPRPEGNDAGPQGPPPHHPPVPPVIAALDTNQDGTISADELKNAPESLKPLDANGDGELSPEELHPHGPPPPPPAGAESNGPPPQDPPPAEPDGQEEPPQVN